MQTIKVLMKSVHNRIRIRLWNLGWKLLVLILRRNSYTFLMLVRPVHPMTKLWRHDVIVVVWDKICTHIPFCNLFDALSSDASGIKCKIVLRMNWCWEVHPFLFLRWGLRSNGKKGIRSGVLCKVVENVAGNFLTVIWSISFVKGNEIDVCHNLEFWNWCKVIEIDVNEKWELRCWGWGWWIWCRGHKARCQQGPFELFSNFPGSITY